MTVKQENEVIRFAKWSIGISLTIAIAVVSMKIAEVKSDSEFKGVVKTQIVQINKSIDDINKKIDAKTEQSSTKKMESMIENMCNDIDHVEFFIASRFGYKPIERGVKL